MELDQMKAAWRDLDQRLQRSDALQLSLRRELVIDRMRGRLRRWLWLPGVELVISLVVTALAMNYLANFATQALARPVGAIPALVVALLGLIGMVANVRQIASVATIDYAGSVLTIQRRLATTRRLRIQLTQLGLLLWLPLWPVFMLFGVQYGFGFDVYRQVLRVWFFGNIAFGLLLAFFFIGLNRRYGTRLARWRPLITLSNSVAGDKLVAASAEMESFARFERE